MGVGTIRVQHHTCALVRALRTLRTLRTHSIRLAGSPSPPCDASCTSAHTQWASSCPTTHRAEQCTRQHPHHGVMTFRVFEGGD